LETSPCGRRRGLNQPHSGLPLPMHMEKLLGEQVHVSIGWGSHLPPDSQSPPHLSLAGVGGCCGWSNLTTLILMKKQIRIRCLSLLRPWGQGVNTTDSAVRITHLPMGSNVVSARKRALPDSVSKATAMCSIQVASHADAKRMSKGWMR
jgi:hypothetical protein